MLRRCLFDWFFYGHLLIAMAAMSLSWLTIRLTLNERSIPGQNQLLSFIFFATLAVYTGHRYLSFQRAKSRPSARRYGLIRQKGKASLAVAFFSLLTAGILGLGFLVDIWHLLLWAIPITVFYLTPPLPGSRRLRDLPYVKVVWVGTAWTIVTVQIPVVALGGDVDFSGIYTAELIIRFLFTVTIAILFDFRDIKLDRSQSVNTIAGHSELLAKTLVYTFVLIIISLITFTTTYPLKMPLVICYSAVIIITFFTKKNRPENWYATVVNGVLLLPPFFYWIFT